MPGSAARDSRPPSWAISASGRHSWRQVAAAGFDIVDVHPHQARVGITELQKHAGQKPCRLSQITTRAAPGPGTHIPRAIDHMLGGPAREEYPHLLNDIGLGDIHPIIEGGHKTKGSIWARDDRDK